MGHLAFESAPKDLDLVHFERFWTSVSIMATIVVARGGGEMAALMVIRVAEISVLLLAVTKILSFCYFLFSITWLSCSNIILFVLVNL